MKSIFGLSHKIDTTSYREVFPIITSQDFTALDSLTQETNVFKDIDNILNISAMLSNLEKRPDTTLNVLDFDDTIYGRHHQLQRSLLQDNRGEEGNRVMEHVIGFDAMIEEFYRQDEAVQRILSILFSQTHQHKAMILTAGRENWQMRKCSAVGINGNNADIVIVDSGRKKPIRLLEYIVSELGFIPGKVIVYEDRVKHFHQSGEALAKLLQSDIVVNEVLLTGKNSGRQIKSIHQKIYGILGFQLR